MRVAMVGLLIGALGAIPSAFAANWQVVNETEKFVDYMDMASFKKNDNIRRVWELRNFKSPRPTPDGKSYHSMKSLNEYDCKNEKKRSTYLIGYSEEMGNGVSIGNSESPSAAWTPVVPESIGETLLRAACSS